MHPVRVPPPVDQHGFPHMAATIRTSLGVLMVFAAFAFSVQAPPATAGRAAVLTFRPPVGSAPLGVRVARYAKRFLGTPYVWGGDSPSYGFDCSGLVRYVYSHFGFDLPHSTYADFDLGQAVTRAALKPGDLVFFHGVGHMGLYIGHGRFIHAPHSGTDVQVAMIDDPGYQASFDGARRVIPRTLQKAAHKKAKRPDPARIWTVLGSTWPA